MNPLYWRSIIARNYFVDSILNSESRVAKEWRIGNSLPFSASLVSSERVLLMNRVFGVRLLYFSVVFEDLGVHQEQGRY